MIKYIIFYCGLCCRVVEQMDNPPPGWSHVVCLPLLQAVSCIGSGIQELWKTHRGGWKTLISTHFLFLSHCWSCLFLKQGRENASIQFEKRHQQGKGLVCEWRALRVFFSAHPSLPPPVKPSDNSGVDRLATNKEGVRGEGGEFDSFFKSGTKYPPPILPLRVSLPLHKSICNPPIYFPCSGVPRLKETSSSLKPQVSRAFDGGLDGLCAPALWYLSTCHCPSSSPIFSSVCFLP